jgi:hypothetical protein
MLCPNSEGPTAGNSAEASPDDLIDRANGWHLAGATKALPGRWISQLVRTIAATKKVKF